MAQGHKAEKWIAVGLAALARGGIDRVRVEVLAQDLGVTKGGFYRQFRDRDALLGAMLDAWAEGRVEAIRSQTELAGDTPQARLASLIRFFADRLNPHGLAIELAIRQWARVDPRAAKAVESVDVERLARVSALYEKMGFGPVDAAARAAIFYAFIFGHELLFLRSSEAERAALVDACSLLLAATRNAP